MPQFSVFLTALESKMLEHTVANPSDWIDNLVEWRVRIAQDEYLPTAIEQLKAQGATSIPATRDEIILAVDLPPKDPNWTPVERDDPNDDLTVEYTFDLEEDDIKMPKKGGVDSEASSEAESDIEDIDEIDDEIEIDDIDNDVDVDDEYD